MTLQIKQLKLYRLGTYSDQFERPIISILDGQSIAEMQSLLSPTGGASGLYPPADFAQAAAACVQISQAPRRPVEIPHGWRMERLGFELVIEHVASALGGALEQRVLGYTDIDGLAADGTVDPQMRFIINSIESYRLHSTAHTTAGAQEQRYAVEATQALRAPWTGIYTSEHRHSQRPMDVLTAISAQMASFPPGTTVDARTLVTNIPTKANLDECIPAVWLHRLCAAYASAQDLAGDEFASEMDFLAQARGMVAISPAARDPFLRALEQLGDSYDSTFNLAQLRALGLQPEQIEWPVQGLPAQLHRCGETALWSEPDLSTQIATTVAQALPSLLFASGLEAVVLESHNADGGLQAFVHEQHSLVTHTPAEHDAKIALFTERLHRWVLAPLLQDNQLGLQLQLLARRNFHATVKLSINGGESVRFGVPLFASALTSSQLSEHDQQQKTAADMHMLLMSLSGQ